MGANKTREPFMLTISKCQNKLYDPDKLTVSSLHTGQTNAKAMMYNTPYTKVCSKPVKRTNVQVKRTNHQAKK